MSLLTVRTGIDGQICQSERGRGQRRVGVDHHRHLRPLGETGSRVPNCPRSHHRTLTIFIGIGIKIMFVRIRISVSVRDVVNRFLWLDTTVGVRESLRFRTGMCDAMQDCIVIERRSMI